MYVKISRTLQSMTILAFIQEHISSHNWQAGDVANTKTHKESRPIASPFVNEQKEDTQYYVISVGLFP